MRIIFDNGNGRAEMHTAGDVEFSNGFAVFYSGGNAHYIDAKNIISIEKEERE